MSVLQDSPSTKTGPSRAWYVQPLMAGFFASIVGYASTFTLVLAGLTAAGATPQQAGSGLFAVCVALGVLNIAIALKTRIPVSIAWSTPGVAFLATVGGVDGGFPAVVGAFIVAAGLIVLAGIWKPFSRAVSAIPAPIANAMLAGILLTLCIAPLRAVEALPHLTLPVIAAWALGLIFFRRYAVPIAVAVAFVILAFNTQLQGSAIAAGAPSVSFIMPVFTLDALIRVAIPLFIVTMASQNLPGLAVMKANGYELDPGPAFAVTGVASAIIAFFGAHTVNLAAITAALCAGPEAHPDPARRWLAPVAAGAGYLIFALLAGLAAALIAASPQLLIQAVAGLALMSSLAQALSGALAHDEDRIPAVVTFVTAASGVTIFGIGAAFWGIVVGVLLSLALKLRR